MRDLWLLYEYYYKEIESIYLLTIRIFVARGHGRNDFLLYDILASLKFVSLFISCSLVNRKYILFQQKCFTSLEKSKVKIKM